MNPGTPTGADLESAAVDLAWLPPLHFSWGEPEI